MHGHEGHHSASIVKGNKKYICRRVEGRAAVLKDVESEVELKIPEGLHGLVIGHIHPSFSHFFDIVPNKECFVSPVPEYKFIPDKTNKNVSTGNWFQIVLPHRIKEKYVKSIRVRHGDIYNDVPFRVIPPKKQDHSSHNDLECFYTVTSSNILIYTRSFSQFVCTSCKKTCRGKVTVLVYEKLFWCDGHMVASLRIRLGSNLFSIKDIRKVNREHNFP